MTGPARLSSNDGWAAAIPAGAHVSVTALRAGSGAALFAWAQGDPYEILSDAYTFMELRRTFPRVGDSLFSTLRRAIVSVRRDDMAPGIDLLIHDAWLPRADYASLAAVAVSRMDLPAPPLGDWPFATNLFVRAGIAPDGALDLQTRGASQAATIVLSAQCPIVAVIVSAGDLEIESGQAEVGQRRE